MHQLPTGACPRSPRAAFSPNFFSPHLPVQHPSRIWPRLLQPQAIHPGSCAGERDDVVVVTAIDQHALRTHSKEGI